MDLQATLDVEPSCLSLNVEAAAPPTEPAAAADPPANGASVGSKRGRAAASGAKGKAEDGTVTAAAMRSEVKFLSPHLMPLATPRHHSQHHPPHCVVLSGRQGGPWGYYGRRDRGDEGALRRPEETDDQVLDSVSLSR